MLGGVPLRGTATKSSLKVLPVLEIDCKVSERFLFCFVSFFNTLSLDPDLGFDFWVSLNHCHQMQNLDDIQNLGAGLAGGKSMCIFQRDNP